MTIDYQSLINARSYRRIAKQLLLLERERGALDLAAMANDPDSAIAASSELEIEYDLSPRDGCSVFGYYRHRPGQPSLIVIHPSLTTERDTFTLLHEVGHHVQRQHLEWANTRYRLPELTGARLEEKVADAIAAELLLPDELGFSHLDATHLAEMYAMSRASRSAIAMRAVDIAGDESAVVAVVDHRGMVIFARACGNDLFAPARGRIQPDLADLVERAFTSGGAIEAEFRGVVTTSGWAQSDVIAQVAMDYTQAYAFVVIRPTQRFGRVPSWDRFEHECSNEACGLVFVVDEQVTRCVDCGDPKCPDCNRCACEPALGGVCENCFMALSIAEQAGQVEHECL